MQTQQQTHDSESGNILIYIIGAIFLIGLLVVITKGSNSPGSNIDRETLILKASKVRAYTAELERGVDYVLRNGHSETEISFAYANHSSTYGTYGTDPTAEIFNPSGGGVEWRDNDTDIQTSDDDWVFTGANVLDQVGTTGATASNADLLAILPNVTEDFCIYINDAAGVTNPADAPPQEDDNFSVTVFTGSFTATEDLADSSNATDAKLEACIEGNGTPASGTYHYYKVLLPR